MATRLYLHDATDNTSGLPTAEQSALVADDNFEADQTRNRTLTTTIGTSQASLANASVSATTLKNYYVARWTTPKLDQTSVAANTWTLNFAAAESNANANFPVSGTNQVIYVNCYVWRTSTSAKVGTILDGNSAAAYDEPLAIDTEKVMHGTFTGSAVSGVTANNDVIIFEMWFQVTQGKAASYTQTIYFDGTTENITENATVTSHASFLETPENLVFVAPPVTGLGWWGSGNGW